MLALVWIIAALSLVFVAVLDPRLASTFARLSFASVGGIGALLTVFLAIRGQDRALSLIPTWILFLVWLFGATTTLTGQLNGDLVVSSLVAGLTLIVVLLGFTVTQFAFGAMEPAYRTAPSEQNLRSLAVDGSGAAVWDWHARRDEIKVSPIVETALGLKIGEMSSKLDQFLSFFHPADKERFRVLLASIRERGSGIIQTDFRLRHTDNSYRWFDLEAASVPTADRRTLRCVGLLRDVTDMRRAQSRLLHDAVHDSVTNLPNRELFLDRLSVALTRAQSDRTVVPKIVYIDIGKFKSVNSSYGLIVGDSLLLALANRLTHHLGSQDTLARVAGDQFAILLLSEVTPSQLAQLAEQLRRAIRAPIRIAGQDVVLTSAIGIAVHDGNATPDTDDNDLLREAEIAMHRAKRQGPDHIEIFRQSMRNSQDDRVSNEGELRLALEKKQIKLFFRPVVYLPREELAGFSALVRWEHPRLGTIDPFDVLPATVDNDLLIKLSSHVLIEAMEQAAEWQRLLPRVEHPIFVSVDISGPQLLQKDFVQEIRHIVGRAIVPDGVLRLAVKEAAAMKNPERAAEFLESLKSAGAKLALDEFGTGYTSLAYLRRFPIDTIGLDQGLVQSASDEQSGSALVRSIVALAHELGKLVTAEGVETAEDASFLRSIGCEYAQGFYYGEPMTDRETGELLKVVRKSERKVQQQSFFRTKSQIERDKLPAANKGNFVEKKQLGDNSSSTVPRSPSSPKTKSERKTATSRAHPSHKVQSSTSHSSSPRDKSTFRDKSRQAPSAQTRKRTIKTSQRQSIESAPPTNPVRPLAEMQPPKPPARPAPTAARSNDVSSKNERLPVHVPAAPPALQSEQSPPMPPVQREDQALAGTSPLPGARTDIRTLGAPPPLPHEGVPSVPDAGSVNENGSPAGARRSGSGDALPDLSSLPPGIAASLARLAGVEDKGPAREVGKRLPPPKK
ncbi:MAG: EAL domain-containing protein, partial [Hyphomicrobiaceae bacterium]